MLQQLRKARRHESGFTLIELLLVIVILGILAAVVVFAVNGIQDRGQQSACKADLATVSSAAEAFDAQNGRYAGSMDELVKRGLLRSVPKSDTYRIDYDPTPDGKSVSITSTYCATNSSAGPTIGPGSDPDSKYCTTLRDALGRYGQLDLSTLDDERFEGLMATFRNLAELGSEEGMRDHWNTFAGAFMSINDTLRKYELRWADLSAINEGRIPKGLEQDQFDRLRERLDRPMNSEEFQKAGQELSRHTASVCGLDMNT